MSPMNCELRLLCLSLQIIAKHSLSSGDTLVAIIYEIHIIKGQFVNVKNNDTLGSCAKMNDKKQNIKYLLNRDENDKMEEPTVHSCQSC